MSKPKKPFSVFLLNLLNYEFTHGYPLCSDLGKDL